jgi:hypothetical protein
MKEELKVYLYQLWPILLLVIGLPLLSYGIWSLMSGKQLEVLVIDKTVRDDTYQEHAALFWTLNHLKYKKADGQYYSLSEDYLGFFPSGQKNFGVSKDLTGKTDEQIRALASRSDLIYIADTYGVYESDFDVNARDARSRKIYGGLDHLDIKLISMAKEEGKVVVAEFNSLASPTSSLIRSEFENLMGIRWTGWIGRYFDELDTLTNGDIPAWMVLQYKRQHTTWDLRGPGLIFIKETGEIEAFRHKVDYDNKVPLIRTQKLNKEGFHLPDVIPYPDWFDVMMIDRDYEVISYYDIEPTAEGVQRLRKLGLPRFFPATVVRNLEKGRQYYLAGDFSDMRGDFGAVQFYGLPLLRRGIYVASDYTNRQSFFWNYYYPLITQILEKVDEARKKPESK